MLEDDTSETTLNGDKIRLSIPERAINKKQEIMNWYHSEESDLKLTVGFSVIAIVLIIGLIIATLIYISIYYLLEYVHEWLALIFVILSIIFGIVFFFVKMDSDWR